MWSYNTNAELQHHHETTMGSNSTAKQQHEIEAHHKITTMGSSSINTIQ
jgi:hypothetical protein